MSETHPLIQALYQWARDWQTSPLPEDRIVQVFGIWLGYPLVAEAIAFNVQPEEQGEAWQVLEHAHDHATRRLMELAKREGLDTAALCQSADVCRRFFRDGRPFPLGSNRRPGSWPDCIDDDQLAEADCRAAREGGIALRQLAACLSIAPTPLIVEATRDPESSRDARTSPPPESPPAGLPKLALIPGGFTYQGAVEVKVDLAGKPWEVLREFVRASSAKRCRLTSRELLATVWKTDPEASDGNCKDAIKLLRKSLRDALTKSGAEDSALTEDPIPCVDRANNLAWELRLE